MKGYATFLKQLPLPTLEAHKENRTLPDFDPYGLTASRASHIFRVEFRRRVNDLVQLNVDVPRTFKERLLKKVGKSGKDLNKAVKEGMSKWMASASSRPASG